MEENQKKTILCILGWEHKEIPGI